jgi:hypothetical protein
MMKTTKTDFSTVSDDVKYQTNKFILSKFEDDLYKEEANVKTQVVRVKYVALPNKGDKWKIFIDNEIIMTILGTKLNKKERVFLRGPDGVNFLIGQVKSGTKSFHGVKQALKIKLKGT